MWWDIQRPLYCKFTAPCNVVLGNRQYLVRIWTKVCVTVFWLTLELIKAQNPLYQFPCNFPVDREAANLLQTCYGHVVYVADLLRFVLYVVGLLRTCSGKSPTCYVWTCRWCGRLVTDLFREAANLLQTCYGHVVYVADLLRFVLYVVGLLQTCSGKLPTCYVRTCRLC